VSPRSRRRPSSSRKKRSRRKSHRGRWALVAVAVIATAVGGGAATGNLDPLTDLLPESLWGEGSGQGGGGATFTRGDLDVERARAQLDELEVGEWAAMTGYSRDRFSHWRSIDGCDARQTVLERDGEDVEMNDDCRAVGGTWYSPFDGQTFTDPGDIDIDHIVPLANSWRTGAAAWDDDRRADFANDLDTPQLIAVSASSNRAKGDQDPSQWKPPERGYWCQYAHDWVVVKHHWELWVTRDEKDALADMLDTCG
jgi:hypothetical protein